MGVIGSRKLPKITDFPPEEVTPAVVMLLEICHQQHEQIQALRDEIARLKGGNPKPPIKPSKLEGKRAGPHKGKAAKGRGQNKRSKTQQLEIHEEIVVPPAPSCLPAAASRATRSLPFRICASKPTTRATGSNAG